MAADTLIERDLEAFLDTVGGNYVAAYNKIVEDEQQRAIASGPRSNAEIRKAAYRKAVATLDRKGLASINKTMRGFVPLVKQNAEITNTTGILDEDQAEDLMIEILEVKRIKEIAASREAAIRARVFNSMTESFAAQGEEFPEHVKGSIEVPKLGLRFARERCGRKDPELDEAKLEKLVGPETWEKVSRVEIIPAQETRVFDADAFMAAARRRPALLEKLRAALVVGEFKSPAFHIRAMDPEQPEE